MKYIFVRSILFICVVTFLVGCCPGSCLKSTATSEYSPAELHVYYFHRTVRCTACNKIEALSQQALQTYFPVELDEKQILWQPMNVDEDVNVHFVDEFGLNTQSLVLVETKEGKQTRWKNLERIWDLLDDDAAFLHYVETEVRAFLDK